MQPPLTTLYRRQADRPNLGTNANQIPTTIYIKAEREPNLLSDAANVTDLKMHRRSLMPIRTIFTKAQGADILCLQV